MKSVKMNELLVVIFNNRDLNRNNMFDTLEILYKEMEEHKLLILDLSEIRHMGDEVTGSLFSLQAYLKEKKKSLRMYRTREELHSVFRKLNLESVMSMAYKTTDDLNEGENLVFYIN